MLRPGGEIPRFDSILRRAAVFALRCLLGLWLFGQAIRFITDIAWYNALGYLPVWRSLLLAKMGLSASFVAVALIVGVPVLRAARHPAGEDPASRVPPPGQWSGTLGRLNNWRRRVPGILLWLTVAEVLLLARGLAGHADEWFLFWHAAQWGYAEPHTGWDASFWVFRLPFLTRWLGALWIYSGTLLLALVVGGGLRALPLVLTRRPAVPLELLRAAYRLGAWLLLLRSLGYILGAANTLGSLSPDSAGWWLVRLSAGLGAAGCVLVAVQLLARQPGNRSVTPGRSGNGMSGGRGVLTGVLLPILAVLWLPPLLSRTLGPWAEGTGLPDKRLQQAAAHAAWGPVEVRSLPAQPLGAAPWPVWDETTLLQANPSARFLDKKIMLWQRATLEWDGVWNMLVAGFPSVSALDTDPREVGENNSQVFVEGPPGRIIPATAGDRSTGFSETNPVRQVSSGNQTPVFGLSGGGALVTKSSDGAAAVGAPFRSTLWRLAWAWRLSDLFLAYGNGDASTVLAFRSVEERAQRVVPFLRPCGSPRAQRVGGRIFWVLDLATVSSHFPGVEPVPAGQFQGANAARHAVKMLLDSGTGEVSFYAAPASQETPDPVLRAWMRTFPGLIHPAQDRPVGRVAEPYPAAILAARAWQENGGVGGQDYSAPYLLGGAARTGDGSFAMYTATWCPVGEAGFNWLAADGAGHIQSVRGHGEVEAVRILLANSMSQSGNPGNPPQSSAAEGAAPTVPPGLRGALPRSEQGYHPSPQSWLPPGARIVAPGQTVLWPQTGAGGGWMVATSAFASAGTGVSVGLSAVAVADLAARVVDNPARVGVGLSLQGALNAREQSMGPAPGAAPGVDGAELVRRALDANEAIGTDFQQGNLGDIGRRLQVQRQWLREYLQRQAPGAAGHAP